MTEVSEGNDAVSKNEGSSEFVQGDRVLVDAVFYKQSLVKYVEDKRGKAKGAKEGILKIPCDESGMPGEPSSGIVDVRIWQLKADAPMEARFATQYARSDLGLGAPKRDEYRGAWEGTVEKYDLEDAWECISRLTSADLGGHRLSVSDVVELTDNAGSRFFYAETEGFAEVEFQ